MVPRGRPCSSMLSTGGWGCGCCAVLLAPKSRRNLEAAFLPLERRWRWDVLGQEHQAEPGVAWALPALANGIGGLESLCDPRKVLELSPVQP